MIVLFFPHWQQSLVNIFVTVFGLIVGSFLNVVVARLPQGRSIVRPRSQCPACHASINWYDNVPVVSFLLLRGKCRACRAPVSLRYPVIELLTGLLFLAAYLRFGISWLLFVHDWPFIAVLIAITFIDLEHRIIPDPLSLGGLALGLATSWAVPDVGFVGSLLGAGVGFGAFFGLAWLYERFTGRSGLGGGDVKLLAMIGAFLGLPGVLFTVLGSSILGSVLGITWALLSRKKDVMKVSIPYGPFLVVAALYYYLLGDLWFRSMIPM